MDYLDFHLKIGPRISRNRYSVSARSEMSGEATGTFIPPLREEQLENFVLKVGITRRGVRKIQSPEWRAAEEFGEKLFRSLFTEQINAAFVASHNEAVRQGKGLRIKLILEAPTLANYPWEFLYDSTNAQFLSLIEDTPLVRYIELPRPVVQLAVAPPLRILAVAASPKDYETLDLARERRNLDTALQTLTGSGEIELDWLPRANLDTLRDHLLKREYHIFHFIGHGGFDSSAQDGVLVFEGDNQSAVRVSGERLAYFLRNHRTLRLAVLNACEGARTSQQDPFAGTAMTLLRTGNLPAVVAMQFEITDTAAIDFARGFYSAIAAGRAVDAAVGQGRQAIFARDNDVEWSTPVLYLRAADGKIFNIDREAWVRELARREREAQARAEQARRENDKREAEQLALAQAEQERRAREQAETNRVAAEKAEAERLAREQAEAERLERERAEQERFARERAEQERVAREREEQARQRAAAISELLQRGYLAFASREWTKAISLLQQVERQESSYHDQVAPMIQEAQAAIEAERARQVAAEQAEAERLAREKAEQERQAEEKQQAERRAGEQAEAKRAAAEKAETERLDREHEKKAAQEAEFLLQTGQAALEAQEWNKAIELFNMAQAQDPHYADTARPLIVRAQSALLKQAHADQEIGVPTKPEPAPHVTEPVSPMVMDASLKQLPTGLVFVLTALLLALGVGSGWAATGVAYIYNLNALPLPLMFSFILFGILGGLFQGEFIQRLGVALRRQHLAVLAAGWVAAFLFPSLLITVTHPSDTVSTLIAVLTVGLIAGPLTAFTLGWSTARLNKSVLVIIAGGWLFAFAIQFIMAPLADALLTNTLFPMAKDLIADEFWLEAFKLGARGFLVGAFSAVVGLGVMYWQLGAAGSSKNA